MKLAWRWIRRMLLLGAALLLLLVLFAHRWFAVSRPSGSTDLVVEGWLYAGGCDTVAAWYRNGTYARFYTTGTARPFTYHLRQGDTLRIDLDEPLQGEASLRIDGLPRASARIRFDGDPAVEADPSTQPLRLALPPCRRIRIAASSSDPPPDGQAILFIGHLAINGVNAHELKARVGIRRATGAWEEGWPSFAHEARSCLIAAGIPPERVTAVPAERAQGGRTWSNARAFVRYAAAHGITGFDVATMGVHARRTWRTYRKAAGHADGIGVRSIHDPWCARGRWWRQPFGWILVLKEVAAIPAPSIAGDAPPSRPER